MPRALCLLILMFLSLLWGCSAWEGAATDASPPTATIAPELTSLIPSSGTHRDLILEVLAETPDLATSEESLDFHREVFSDGEVKYSEYERAKYAEAECARNLGFEIEGPFRWGEGGMLVVEPGTDPRWRLTYMGIEAEGLDVVMATCQERWGYRIEQVLGRSLAPTEQEVQMWIEAGWACAREKQLDISEPPSLNDAMDSVGFGCEPWLVLPDRLRFSGHSGE